MEFCTPRCLPGDPCCPPASQSPQRAHRDLVWVNAYPGFTGCCQCYGDSPRLEIPPAHILHGWCWAKNIWGNANWNTSPDSLMPLNLVGTWNGWVGSSGGAPQHYSSELTPFFATGKKRRENTSLNTKWYFGMRRAFCSILRQLSRFIKKGALAGWGTTLLGMALASGSEEFHPSHMAGCLNLLCVVKACTYQLMYLWS